MATRKPKANAKQKMLTVSDITKIDSVLDERISVSVMDDQYIVNVDKKFRATKISNFVIDFQDSIRKLYDEHGVTLDTFGKLMSLNYILIIKHFTSLGGDMPTDLNELLHLGSKFVDTGILFDIISAIDPEEIGKLNKAIEDSKKTNGDIAEKITNSLLENNVFGEVTE